MQIHRSNPNRRRNRRGATNQMPAEREATSTSIVRIPRDNVPFPNSMIITSRWSQYVNSSVTFGVGALQTLRMNAWTSNFTYYTQLSPLYSRYRVLRARWLFRCSTASGGAQYIAVVPINGTNSDTSTTQLMGLPRAKNKMFLLYRPVTLQGQVSLADLNGVTSQEYAIDDRFQGNIGANPIEVMGLYWITDNSIAASSTNNLQITLELDVQLMDVIMNY